MKSINPIRMNLGEKLKDPDYFYNFFMGRCQDEIATAIIDMRAKRNNTTQAQLAEVSGMKQSAISRLENSSYARWNFQTLWRIARALRGRWKLVLEPMEDVIKEYEFREKELTSDLLQETGVLSETKQAEKTPSPLREPKPGGIYDHINPESRSSKKTPAVVGVS